MPSSPQVMMIHGGGLRSLVAAAMLSDKPLAMLHIHDGRAADAQFHAAFIRQAERFAAARRSEITVAAAMLGAEPGADLTSAVGAMQYLAAAAEAAAAMRIDRIAWPVMAGGEADAVARAIEVAQLLEHAAAIDSELALHIEMPLLEFTPRQLLEVGQQMDVPWDLARSCLRETDEPCGDCAGCRWRFEAFQAAGIEDAAVARR